MPVLQASSVSTNPPNPPQDKDAAGSCILNFQFLEPHTVQHDQSLCRSCGRDFVLLPIERGTIFIASWENDG